MAADVSQCWCVVSLVDRLVHRSEVIAVEADSYRLKEEQERSEPNGQATAYKQSRAGGEIGRFRTIFLGAGVER